jgi:molybdopterin converting factor small subunit
MKVQVKLFATLQRYAPDGKKAGDPFEVELPEKSNIGDLTTQLGIRPREAKVAFVNGRARAEMYRLKEGDEIGLFPPVGGG